MMSRPAAKERCGQCGEIRSDHTGGIWCPKGSFAREFTPAPPPVEKEWNGVDGICPNCGTDYGEARPHRGLGGTCETFCVCAPSPSTEPVMKEPNDEFLLALESAINVHSQENVSNTPDFILAELAAGCLAAFDKAVNRRAEWYGRKDVPGQVTTSTEPGSEGRLWTLHVTENDVWVHQIDKNCAADLHGADSVDVVPASALADARRERDEAIGLLKEWTERPLRERDLVTNEVLAFLASVAPKEKK